MKAAEMRTLGLIKGVTKRNRMRNNDMRPEFSTEPVNSVWTCNENEGEQIPEKVYRMATARNETSWKMGRPRR